MTDTSVIDDAGQTAEPLLTSEGETLFFLVRHGETEWNREHRFQGHLDVPLSREGKRQAEEVGRWLSTLAVPFRAIFASDLKRAAQTASAIGRQIGITPESAAALREINCGDWQGLLASEVEELFPGKLDEWRTVVDRCVAPGGESLLEVQSRAFKFFLEVARQHVGGAVVIISHGAALSALMAAIRGDDLSKCWNKGGDRLDNTGVTTLAYSPDCHRARIVAVNYTGHLATNADAASGWPA